MPPRNTPQKTLESWKQIAAYLDRSERTVRRWEASEGLPVHRREHEKQDTVFAYKHEIEAWSRLRTKCPDAVALEEAESLPPAKPSRNTCLTEHDAITPTCIVTSPAHGPGMAISCALRFILQQPSPVTARELNTAARWNTFSNG